MINKTLFVYNSLNLFKILHEIKENLYFEIKHIDQKDYKTWSDLMDNSSQEFKDWYYKMKEIVVDNKHH